MTEPSINTALADAARWYASRATRIPEPYRPDAAVVWRELMYAVESANTRRAALDAIRDWRERVDEALASRLMNAPLDNQ